MNDKLKSKDSSSETTVREITRTVLYEGYSLYPYYRSSPKNAKPVPFGAVYPKDYASLNEDVHSTTQTQCILAGNEEAEVNIRVKFLHLRNRHLLAIDHDQLGPGQFKPTDTLQVGDKTYQAGWEAVEREIEVGVYPMAQLVDETVETSIEFEGEQANDLIYHEDETIAGNVIIEQSGIRGKVSISADRTQNKKGFRLTINITNNTPVNHPDQCGRNDVYKHAFLSTHTILQTDAGHFISQTDPGPEWKQSVAGCENINTWPILIEKDDKTMLASPIVLYDYPEIAPESHGDMFDAGEIEEALVLHMATLPEAEKERINRSDPKMKAMMERVESVTPEELLALHGGFKDVNPNEGSDA